MKSEPKIVMPGAVLSMKRKQWETSVPSIAKQLNQMLTKWDGENALIIPVAKFGANTEIRNRVEQLVKQAGWNVKYQSDQRDGDYYEVSVNRKAGAR